MCKGTCLLLHIKQGHLIAMKTLCFAYPNYTHTYTHTPLGSFCCFVPRVVILLALISDFLNPSEFVPWRPSLFFDLITITAGCGFIQCGDFILLRNDTLVLNCFSFQIHSVGLLHMIVKIFTSPRIPARF